MEFGWENFVDNVKNCWENCEGDLESWVDDWKNYWIDESGWFDRGWSLFCWLHEKFG